MTGGVGGAPEEGIGRGGTESGDGRKPLEETGSGRGELRGARAGKHLGPRREGQTVAEAGTGPRGWWPGSGKTLAPRLPEQP